MAFSLKLYSKQSFIQLFIYLNFFPNVKMSHNFLAKLLKQIENSSFSAQFCHFNGVKF